LIEQLVVQQLIRDRMEVVACCRKMDH